MKILLDENVAMPLTNALRSFLFTHDLRHVSEEAAWSGTPDVELYKRAAQEGYDAVLTTDAKQMQRANEVAAIAASGIHRIEYSQRHAGLVGLGVAIGTVCAGLPVALAELADAPSQQLVYLQGVDPTSRARLKMTDPATSPPKFWPA
ncbi:hypothetical protein Cs7R123_69180 [Catellatospora sp. TT07R-123]|uniref:PIN-like domain-containing protein n=1 Tax=Catellatospora sp. TT07R-123 TaxID=2733863 RepID=UPI001B2914BC|nr:DUF5615 family PIN-like protein [Catellatospora sp. TT07R-123]GHJ49576.1 hypothetical protein Cs7R123_69180 [Catellatospora sp. TT07R-123]